MMDATIKFRDVHITGKIVKTDDRYVVKDNTTLKNLVVSSTNLNPNKSTTGHSHKGQEEVYYFIRGGGIMELDDNHFEVNLGYVVLVEDGVFHRVNAGPNGCYFLCVLQGDRHE